LDDLSFSVVLVARKSIILEDFKQFSVNGGRYQQFCWVSGNGKPDQPTAQATLDDVIAFDP
jgi:hypothetical protein